MNKTLKISIAIVTLILLATALYVVLSEDSGWNDIPNVAGSFERSFSDRSMDAILHGELAIHIKGSIDGTAVLHTTYGDIHLADGSINSIMISHEYWSKKCDIRYEPLSVKSGNLSVRVAIGSLPTWARKPLLGAVPVNYKGGWRTWHANRKQLYSQGFYRDGHKKGSWSYWDKQGQLTKTEQWKDGKLIGTSNK